MEWNRSHSNNLLPIKRFLCDDTNDKKTRNTGEYACPICSKDLTSMTSSYLRQRHIDKCLSEPPKDEQNLSCFFCNKNLSHFTQTQTEQHINRCLDTEESNKQKLDDSLFAGQSVPFLDTLEICPCCHEFTPFLNKSLKVKVKHIKQCAKHNKISIPQLLQKFKWIGWGHTPIPHPKKQVVEDTPLIPMTYDYEVTEPTTDDDFQNEAVVHKIRREIKKPSRKEDAADEQLQTVLALSRSLLPSDHQNKSNRLKPSNHRDWNAANIISIEESKQMALNALPSILLSDKKECTSCNHILGPSELSVFIPHAKHESLWELASCNSTTTTPFLSRFIRELLEKKTGVLIHTKRPLK
ncbi:hypothetical protein BDB01DRAFT_723797 [Pilobolus umbonatus]|nr:hypothetical protein BDB01DRAFT_723797 [Pilobolus umbonatus]